MQTVKFTAEQSLQLLVPEQEVPIHHYLRQPHRLVKALADPDRIEQLAEDRFCLKMRSLNFLTFTLQPTVYIQVWAEKDGTVHIQSTGCEIRGIEYIDRRFSLQLTGKLTPQQIQGQTHLLGNAHLQVCIDLPPAMWLTPKAIIEPTGNGLLKSVLMAVKQKLMHQLLADYLHWAKSQQPELPAAPSGSLTIGSSNYSG
jgi:hypothetical protein